MLTEYELIKKMTQGFERNPLQLNGYHESDAELVRLTPDGPIIAITIDSIVEEIETRLYDYYLLGWMTVMANVSDLAAVGATPTGIVISQGIPCGLPDYELSQLHSGILDATREAKISLLGGDTNISESISMTGTALGWIQDNNPMTRTGCKAGDIVAITGRAGIGNLFAYQKIFEDRVSVSYLPKARIKEGLILRNYASSCMDTSDGVFHTMNEIGRLNNIGFRITSPLCDILIDNSLSQFPAWMLLAGIHGEFELLVTVPQEKWFQAKSALPLIEIGEVVQSPGIYYKDYYFAPGIIENAWSEAKNIPVYLNNLLFQYR